VKHTEAGDEALLQQALAIAQSVVDPELPFLTIEDLGILRSVALHEGRVVARVSPTYTGCPAVSVIEQSVLNALTDAGIDATVERVISPPWSTDMITETGRQKLLDNGISPPESVDGRESDVFFTRRVVNCPRCGSDHTEMVSEFGSTPCKSQYRCRDCREPFDHFKCH
jgi:ring-1,2-phenylacetyl-CoA epoxidase subunit PaaD